MSPHTHDAGPSPDRLGDGPAGPAGTGAAHDAGAGILLDRETLRSVLDKVAERAKREVPGVAEAAIAVLRGRSPVSASWTGLLAYELHEAQYASGSGPCLEATSSGRTVSVQDMRAEARWPAFAAAAARQGASSSLSIPMPLGEHARAVLTVYGREVGAFDEESVVLAQEFAGRSAVLVGNMHALHTARATVVDLQVAMQSRAAIEQAKGILMGQHGLTPQEAFEVLSQRSQNANRKVRDIAQEMVDAAAGPRPAPGAVSPGPAVG